MQVKYRRFTDGYVFASEDIAQVPGTKALLCAPLQLAGPPPFVVGVIGKESIIYRFLFWNVLDQPLSQKQCVSADTSATAWYVPEGGGPGISTFVFSVDGDYSLTPPETPIGDVLPPGHFPVSTASSLPLSDVALTITAKPSIMGLPSAQFDGWIQFGSAAINGSSLNVPAHSGTYAIAAYRTPVQKIVQVYYYYPRHVPDATATIVTHSGDPFQTGR